MRTDEREHRSGGTSTKALPSWKRLLDLAVIVLFLPVLVVVGGVVCLVIKLGSPGPVLFLQKRVGYRGREFTIYKFRTMLTNADTRSLREHMRYLIKARVPMTKLEQRHDAGLIPLGRVLRATGLDELPQIINVIGGEMSLVGPRPCIPYEYELYEPWQRDRLGAVPGLTGLWQVSGKNRTTFEEMVRLDVQYARHRSLLGDLRILALTVPAVFRQCEDMWVALEGPGAAAGHVNSAANAGSS
jgi:exopolysaccharide production protein ExoY